MPMYLSFVIWEYFCLLIYPCHAHECNDGMDLRSWMNHFCVSIWSYKCFNVAGTTMLMLTTSVKWKKRWKKVLRRSRQLSALFSMTKNSACIILCMLLLLFNLKLVWQYLSFKITLHLLIFFKEQQCWKSSLVFFIEVLYSKYLPLSFLKDPCVCYGLMFNVLIFLFSFNYFKVFGLGRLLFGKLPLTTTNLQLIKKTKDNFQVNLLDMKVNLNLSLMTGGGLLFQVLSYHSFIFILKHNDTCWLISFY